MNKKLEFNKLFAKAKNRPEKTHNFLKDFSQKQANPQQPTLKPQKMSLYYNDSQQIVNFKQYKANKLNNRRKQSYIKSQCSHIQQPKQQNNSSASQKKSTKLQDLYRNFLQKNREFQHYKSSFKQNDKKLTLEPEDQNKMIERQRQLQRSRERAVFSRSKTIVFKNNKVKELTIQKHNQSDLVKKIEQKLQSVKKQIKRQLKQKSKRKLQIIQNSSLKNSKDTLLQLTTPSQQLKKKIKSKTTVEDNNFAAENYQLSHLFKTLSFCENNANRLQLQQQLIRRFQIQKSKILQNRNILKKVLSSHIKQGNNYSNLFSYEKISSNIKRKQKAKTLEDNHTIEGWSNEPYNNTFYIDEDQ